MAKHRHKWIKAPPRWSCTWWACTRSAIVSCTGKNCRENGDLTGRCAEHGPKSKPTKRKTTPTARWSPSGTALYYGRLQFDMTSDDDVRFIAELLNDARVVLPKKAGRA